MLLGFFLPLLVFAVVTFGLAWPFAARLNLDQAEKLVASVVLSLLATYLVAFVIYVLRLPVATFYLLPVLGAVGLLTGFQSFKLSFRDPVARAMLVGQLLVTGWCVGWLFFIVSYSGGGWASDWFEHWERTRFFLDHLATDTRFLALYPLPARPPLANLVTGALLAASPGTYAHYQLFMALLNSLAFLPAALLVRRWQVRPAGAPTRSAFGAVAVLAVLLMLNPSFVENATFAWTKLITVCFVLSGLYFFLRTFDPDAPRATAPLSAAALASGVLAHYSAGPYVLVLAVAWLVLGRARATFWRQTLLLAAIGALILATWLGWSLATYGAHTTLLSNSSVDVKDAHQGSQLLKIALNLRDTIVPHFWRPLDASLIAQTSRWGYWHDWFFQLYQLNLFLMFGSVGWLVLGRELRRSWAASGPRGRWFWATFVVGVVLLGVAVHGARDTWGLGHICLQGLVVLGLAYLAAHWTALSRGWRIVLIAGAVCDFFLGIALHFSVQSFLFDGWFSPEHPLDPTLPDYSLVTRMNAAAKSYHHLAFFSEASLVPPALVLVLLAVILGVALARARQRVH